jgi:transcriptional regulator with PAS, ATPase and Fis domain
MDQVVIVGESPPMKKVYEQVRKVAALPVTVLITGETGTGKDLIASRIHQMSERSGGPFVPINVGAIPRELIGSTLFGHEKGAFTGADRQASGVFAMAAGGTLFLDEIETMDERTQINLLRVLESKQYQRIGSTEFVPADVRILAATNQDLGEAIRNGSFREDLYYRLNVFSLEIPPLRERGQDIMLLTKHFLRHYAQELGKKVTGISGEAENLLLSYDWPGNVRELENLILRAVVSAEGDTLSEDLLTGAEDQDSRGDERIEIEVGSSLEALERSLIKLTLDNVMGSKTLAAEMLGLSRKGIYNKIKRHNL